MRCEIEKFPPIITRWVLSGTFLMVLLIFLVIFMFGTPEEVGLGHFLVLLVVGSIFGFAIVTTIQMLKCMLIEHKASTEIPAVETESEHPRIAGWLILLAAGMALNPLILLIQILNKIELLFRMREHSVQYEYFMSFPVSLLININLFDVAGRILFLLFSCFLAFQFFTKKRKFPKMFIFFMLSITSFAAFVFLWPILGYNITFGGFPDLSIFLYFFNSTGVIALALASAIWIPYIKLSRRVRQTFVC